MPDEQPIRPPTEGVKPDDLIIKKETLSDDEVRKHIINDWRFGHETGTFVAHDVPPMNKAEPLSDEEIEKKLINDWRFGHETGTFVAHDVPPMNKAEPLSDEEVRKRLILEWRLRDVAWKHKFPDY